MNAGSRFIHCCLGDTCEGGVKPSWYSLLVLVLVLGTDVDDVLASESLGPKALYVRKIDFDFVIRCNTVEGEVEPSATAFNLVRCEQWVVALDGEAGKSISEECCAVLDDRISKLHGLHGRVSCHLDARWGFIYTWTRLKWRLRR